MNPSRLIADLQALGIVLVVRNGALRAQGPASVLTPEVQRHITKFKGPLLATLSGQAVPTDDPNVVWDPRGGLRCTRPADLRALALAAAAALPRPFPRMSFEVSGIDIEPGAAAWRTFCRTVPLDVVAEALLVMDDPDAVEAAEADAICLLFCRSTWRPFSAPTTLADSPPTSPHVAPSSPTPTPVPSLYDAPHAGQPCPSGPPHLANQESHP